MTKGLLENLTDEQFKEICEAVSNLLNDIEELNYTVDYWFNYDSIPESAVYKVCDSYRINLEKLVNDFLTKDTVSFFEGNIIENYYLED